MKFGVTFLKVPDSKLIGPNLGPLKKVDSGVFYGIKLLIFQDLHLVIQVEQNLFSSRWKDLYVLSGIWTG